ncbi:glycosyltransferase family 2 protein [Dysgonomonas sp.]
MRNLAPILLFVYKRPIHTQKTLEYLANNALAKESILYIYADGPKEGTDLDGLKKIEETRKVIRAEQWCNEIHIIESNTNKGLANSIIEGVTEIINRHGKVIVLEDDIITSTGFLKYMNEALNLYEEQEKVMHISGFVPVTTGADKLPETYFLRFMSCWGWATWKRAWSEIILDIPYLYNNIPLQDDFYRFNMDGTIDMFSQIEENYKGSLNTWAIKWYSTIFLKKGFCLYPQYSMIDNIGLDGSGEHCHSSDDLYKVDLAATTRLSSIKIKEDQYAYKYLKRFYKYGRDSSLKHRIKIFIKSNYFYKVYAKYRYNL